MSGWKTKCAGLLAIAYGLLGWAFDIHGADEAMRFVVDGVGILGLGHKIEKAARTFATGPSPQGRGEDMSDEDFAAFVRRQQE